MVRVQAAAVLAARRLRGCLSVVRFALAPLRARPGLPALAVTLLLLLPAASSAQQVCNGVPYPAPVTPVAQVGPPVYAGHATAFGIRSGSDVVLPGSVVFEVDGPGGHATITADKDQLGSYTPPDVGRYTVSARWRQFACADGDRSTYYDVTTPQVTFDALPGEQPKVGYRTIVRPRARNAPGAASLLAFLVCPGRAEARRSDDAELAAYYELGSAMPTHRSRRLKLKVPGGCASRVQRLPKRTVEREGLYINVSRGQILVTATEPLRLRVLLEIKVAGRLLGRTYGTFRPSRTGEGVRRS